MFDKYKSNPIFAMYDIYHWEAHPNSSYPRVENVSQRVPHYEAYLKKYPFITLPGLVDDGSDAQKCVVSRLFKANYTTIVTVGLDGKVKYRKDFPNNWSNAYKGLDDILASIVPTNIVTMKAAGKPSHCLLNDPARNVVYLMMPDLYRHSFALFDLKGKTIVMEEGYGLSGYNLTKTAPPGIYILHIEIENKIYRSPLHIIR